MSERVERYGTVYGRVKVHDQIRGWIWRPAYYSEAGAFVAPDPYKPWRWMTREEREAFEPKVASRQPFTGVLTDAEFYSDPVPENVPWERPVGV